MPASIRYGLFVGRGRVGLLALAGVGGGRHATSWELTWRPLRDQEPGAPEDLAAELADCLARRGMVGGPVWLCLSQELAAACRLEGSEIPAGEDEAREFLPRLAALSPENACHRFLPAGRGHGAAMLLAVRRDLLEALLAGCRGAGLVPAAAAPAGSCLAAAWPRLLPDKPEGLAVWLGPGGAYWNAFHKGRPAGQGFRAAAADEPPAQQLREVCQRAVRALRQEPARLMVAGPGAREALEAVEVAAADREPGSPEFLEMPGAALDDREILPEGVGAELLPLWGMLRGRRPAAPEGDLLLAEEPRRWWEGPTAAVALTLAVLVLAGLWQGQDYWRAAQRRDLAQQAVARVRADLAAVDRQLKELADKEAAQEPLKRALEAQRAAPLALAVAAGRAPAGVKLERLTFENGKVTLLAFGVGESQLRQAYEKSEGLRMIGAPEEVRGPDGRVVWRVVLGGPEEPVKTPAPVKPSARPAPAGKNRGRPAALPPGLPLPGGSR